MRIIAPFLCGLIFGAGLLVSGMVQPTKVLAFLDVFGVWDPSLAVVMAAALAVAVPGFALANRRAQPILARQNILPAKTQVDAPLLLGAGLFGIGWGLVGLCPGPALENLATLSPAVVVFVVAMGAAMVVHDGWQSSRSAVNSDSRLASATDG
jgi:uncharacterized membrane protein YedE/YeeE